MIELKTVLGNIKLDHDDDNNVNKPYVINIDNYTIIANIDGVADLESLKEDIDTLIMYIKRIEEVENKRK